MASSREAAATVDIKIRMKEPLRAKIEEAAKNHGVSMNAEMVSRLNNSFTEEQTLGGPSLLSLFLAAADIARSQSYAAGLNQEDFLKAKWVENPELVDRIADNFAALVRMLARTPTDRQEND
jgi:hypothetical protein